MPVLMPVSESKGAFEVADFADSKAKAKVGIALRHPFVRILSTPMQINQLRSFPSEIRVSALFAKIKNYPANSWSKFSHYSSSIILLEVVPVSSKFLRVTDIIPVPKGAVPDNRIVLVQR